MTYLEEEKPKNFIKLPAQILLAVICLGVIFVYAQNKRSTDREEISTVAMSGQMDNYQLSQNTFDPAVLSNMAKSEAQQMIATGDIAQFEQELAKNGLLTPQ